MGRLKFYECYIRKAVCIEVLEDPTNNLSIAGMAAECKGKMSMLEFVKAIWMAICHPFDVIHLTIVRRYADAQGHYIGELYEGNGRDARMIGASCDNFPLDQDARPEMANPRICWRHSFLEPLPTNTLRVGSFEPSLNGFVQRYMARRRFCIKRLVVLNRFVEHVLEVKR